MERNERNTCMQEIMESNVGGRKRNERNLRLDWIEAFLEDRDMPYYACKTAKESGRPVVIASAAGRVLAFHDPGSSGIVPGNFCPQVSFGRDWRHLEFLTCGEIPLFKGDWTDDSGKKKTEYNVIPLVSEGRLLGYLYLLGEPVPNPAQMDHLWQAALTLLLVLKERERRQREEEGYQTEFIRDIIYNNYDSRQAILEKARFWHWDLDGAWALIVAEESAKADGAQDPAPRGKASGSEAWVGGTDALVAQAAEKSRVGLKDWIVRALPSAWAGHSREMRRPHAIVLNAQLLVLLPLFGDRRSGRKAPVSSFLLDWTESGRRLGLGPLAIGVGTFADSITDIYKTYQEAKLALELGKAFAYTTPCYFAEMGVLKFVFGQPARELQEFAERVLGTLSAYDRETEASLLDTLLSYFEARMQVPDCARTLFVHENTLRSRLKKIEQVTGYDLRRVDHLTNLYIALQIMRLGGQVPAEED